MADEPIIALRGHTLLCLQGFRGEGYSPAFVDNMAAIHAALAANPDRLIRLHAEPDTVCAACPHLAAGCTLNGLGSESEMARQDRDVLARLDLTAGAVVTWRDVLARIRRAISGDDLPSICGSCRWLPLGYCAEGLKRLRV